jgi:protein-tyrosine phosphatase family protein
MSRTVVLPSGARVRGRKLDEIPHERADFLLALAEGPMPPWPHRRIAWPDFWVPRDRLDALDALREALRRARDGEIVEVACSSGRGRTGTALAALAVLDGMPANAAISWVRQQYDSRAVETPWQAWWVRRLERVPGPVRSRLGNTAVNVLD